MIQYIQSIALLADRSNGTSRMQAGWFFLPTRWREGREEAVKWDIVMTSTSVFPTIFDTRLG